MMHRGTPQRLGRFSLLFLTLGPQAVAQQRPDLSGTWVATKDAPASAAPSSGPVFGAQFAVRQDGQTVTLIRRVRDTNIAATYPTDGSEVRVRLPGALCMADSESIETAAWDGDALALTVVGSAIPAGGNVQKLSVRRVLKLQAPGTLVVEASLRDPAQPAPRTVGTVYKPSAELMTAPPAPQTPRTPATLAQLGWLAGTWAGASGSEERWTPPTGGSMIGVSRTLRNGAMTAFEFLCIAERGGGLVYQAMPNGRSPATDFTLTRLDAQSATFENPAHDFPKAIRYSLLADGTLEAVISGDAKQRAITFTFKKGTP